MISVVPPIECFPKKQSRIGHRLADYGRTVFDREPAVFALEPFATGFVIDLRSVPVIVQRWREAILSKSNGLPERIRTLLSGHDPDGSRYDGPHLAFLPLASVGHPRANGRLRGMGLVLPRDIPSEEDSACREVLRSVEELALGSLGKWRLLADSSVTRLWEEQAITWNAPDQGATHWATITPIVFDRHPKARGPNAWARQARETIATACTRIGLPSPREAIPTWVAAHFGAPPAFEFPRLVRKDGSIRQHAHAILVFEEPVRGPLLLGAGRYRGYGACRMLP